MNSIGELLIIVVLFLTTLNCLVTYLCSSSAIKSYTVKKDYSKAINKLRKYDNYILNVLTLLTGVSYVVISYFYFVDLLKVSDFFITLSIALGFLLTLFTVFFSRLCYCYACNIILKTKLNEYECFMENMFSLAKVFYPIFILSFGIPCIYLLPIQLLYRHIILAIFLILFVLIHINSISSFNILSLKAKRIKDEKLLTLLNKIFQENGISHYKLYYWDSSRSNDANAMVSGFFNIYFFISTSLISTLSDQELTAVVLHEIGHIKNNHIKKSVITQFVLLSLVASALYSIIILNVYNLLAMLLIILAFVFILGFQLKVSQKREDQADMYANKKGYGEYLIQALNKISLPDDETSVFEIHKSNKDREKLLKESKDDSKE